MKTAYDDGSRMHPLKITGKECTERLQSAHVGDVAITACAPPSTRDSYAQSIWLLRELHLHLSGWHAPGWKCLGLADPPVEGPEGMEGPGSLHSPDQHMIMLLCTTACMRANTGSCAGLGPHLGNHIELLGAHAVLINTNLDAGCVLKRVCAPSIAAVPGL